MRKIYKLFENKPIFIIIDEAEVSGTNFLNVLVGDIAAPSKAYLFDFVPIGCSPNSLIIAQTISATISNLQCAFNNFHLLL